MSNRFQCEDSACIRQMQAQLPWRVAAFVLGCLCAIACALSFGSSLASADEPLEKLIAQLKQPINGGRVDAARQIALRGQDASSATDALIDCLRDPAADIRLTAAYALGCVQIDPSHVLKALVPCLADSDEHVRYSVQWSVARISQSLRPDMDESMAADLVPLLETAIKEITYREHQPRHLIAIEIALARVNQLVTHVAVVPAPVPAVVVPQNVINEDAERERKAAELATSAYTAADVTGRYQFLSKLSDTYVYPDSLRLIVLDYEVAQADDALLRFAVRVWGESAQSLFRQRLQTAADTQQIFVGQDAKWIQLFLPSNPVEYRQLIDVTKNTQQPFEVRCACSAALTRALATDDTIIREYAELLKRDDVEEQLKWVLADDLTTMGPRAATIEAELIDLLGNTKDMMLRARLAQALSKISPKSRAAFQATYAAFTQCPTDDASLADYVIACGQFGSLAKDATANLARCLMHTDEFVQQSAAQALAKIGMPAASAASTLVSQIANPAISIAVKMS